MITAWLEENCTGRWRAAYEGAWPDVAFTFRFERDDDRARFLDMLRAYKGGAEA